MVKEFYALKEFKIVPQVDDKLCWAACLESLVAYFDKTKLIPKFQETAASQYCNEPYVAKRSSNKNTINIPINEG